MLYWRPLLKSMDLRIIIDSADDNEKQSKQRFLKLDPGQLIIYNVAFDRYHQNLVKKRLPYNYRIF
jgi:hypothetical protein